MKNGKSIPLREEINNKYKWHLEDIYSSKEDFEKAFENSKNEIDKILSFKGKLNNSSDTLLNCLKECDRISLEIDKIYVYANMKFHEDSTVSESQILSNRAESLITEYMAKTSFITPEILTIPKENLNKFIEENKSLKLYTHFLENIQRESKHILSDSEEKILSQFSEISSSPQNIFTMLNDADMTFKDIENEKGEKVQLTKGRYVSFLENKSREVRKEAFNSLYDSYLDHKNTIAATYYGNVKSDVITANIRGYSSALEMALSDDNIPVSVYDNLVDTVRNNLNLLHRYVSLRKKILKVDQLHMYDLYVPLTEDFEMEIPYEKAQEIVLEGLKPMGEDYIENLKKGFNGGWIDVHENKGKRGGAYSWGTYSVHPYVLLNHQDNINSTFTLAHEMGHALHSYYTWEKQPYIYSGHKIFVAEVASTCNEVLLIKHLLKTTDDKEFKKYLVNYFLEQFRGTFFRQTMFAEFEKIAHEMVQRGEPLTADNLSALYHKLNCDYFGDDIIVDEKIDIEWARIPHFYNSFYVYQYSTGYCAAIALAEKILAEGESAVKKYKEFLSKGNSEYSIDLLKGAGVDMTEKAPLESAMKVFESLLDEMEKLFL